MTFVTTIKEVHVEPTTVCQAECPMCPRTLQGYHLHKIPNKHLTLVTLQDKLSSIVTNLQKVLFCGTLGEPAACSDLLDMIAWIKSQSPSCVIGMNTNGGIRDTKWWQSLANLIKDNPYNYVVFSFDGLQDTNHLYRKNVDWNKAIENAQAFIQAGGSAHWDMLVFKHNQNQVEEAKQYATELGFRFFRTKVSSRFEIGSELLPPDKHEYIDTPIPLNCIAEETSSVYLSAAGLWYPCCYTHMSNETNFDIDWGKPILDIAARHEAWANIFNPVKKICNRACATMYNKGQWKNSWELNV